jgi:hypothetical protein
VKEADWEDVENRVTHCTCHQHDPWLGHGVGCLIGLAIRSKVVDVGKPYGCINLDDFHKVVTLHQKRVVTKSLDKAN